MIRATMHLQNYNKYGISQCWCDMQYDIAVDLSISSTFYVILTFCYLIHVLFLCFQNICSYQLKKKKNCSYAV